MHCRSFCGYILLFTLFFSTKLGLVTAQSAVLKVVTWQPISQLVVEKTNILKQKFPVIDIQDHLAKLENTAKYLEEIDIAGLWKVVS